MEIGKLFGNETASKALLFLARYQKTTASEIASVFKISKTQVYLQLVKMEKAGILSSQMLGNQRLFKFNSRSPIKNELQSLLEKYIEAEMPIDRYKDFYMVRRRSRSRGKTLGGAYER